jgi:hypothetical protein
MRPVHGNFRDAVAPLPRHDQDLDIETEAVHSHTGKQILSGPRLEQLKAALRVLDAGISEPLHEKVEGSADQMSVQLGLHLDSAGRVRPRADCHVGAGVERPLQSLKLTDRRGTISIGKEDQTPERVHNSASDGVSLAVVGSEADDSKLGELFAKLPAYRGRAVSTSVVYQNHFERP